MGVSKRVQMSETVCVAQQPGWTLSSKIGVELYQWQRKSAETAKTAIISLFLEFATSCWFLHT